MKPKLQNPTNNQPAHPTADTLVQRCIAMVQGLNQRSYSTILEYASPDFIYRYASANGQIVELSAHEMTAMFAEKFQDEPNHRFEIVDTVAYMEDDGNGDPSYGRVWMTVVVRDGEVPGGRERIAIYAWRKESDEQGGERWVWWKQECPSSAALLPL